MPFVFIFLCLYTLLLIKKMGAKFPLLRSKQSGELSNLRLDIPVFLLLFEVVQTSKDFLI